MKSVLVFLLLLAFVVYLRLAHWKEAGGEIPAFQEIAPSKDGKTAYGTAARAALESRLLELGYRSPAPLPSQPDRTRYTPPRHLLRIDVLVTTRRGDSTGFDVAVAWAKEGLSWTVDQREKRAKDLAAALAAWWAEYQATHPKP